MPRTTARSGALGVRERFGVALHRVVVRDPDAFQPALERESMFSATVFVPSEHVEWVCRSKPLIAGSPSQSFQPSSA